MTEDEIRTLTKIAQENIPSLKNRPDLEPRQSDEQDFIDVSVWCLKDALIAAYEAGKAAAVPSSRWRKYSSDEWICTHCGYDLFCDTLDGGELPPYCEKCGAQMQNYLTAAGTKREEY